MIEPILLKCDSCGQMRIPERLFMCKPCYTRHQEITADFVKRLEAYVKRKKAEQLCGAAH